MSRVENPGDVVIILGGIGLLPALLVSGPLGWFLYGLVWVVMAAAVFTDLFEPSGADGPPPASQDGPGGGDAPQFCVNCGDALDTEIHDAADTTEEFHVNYCGSCGAPLVAGGSGTDDQGSENEQPIERENCPECGVLNGIDRTECRHCHSSL